MSVEQALYDRLTGYAGLIALVGDKIYAVTAPQGIIAPFVVFQKISPGRKYAMGGYVGIQETRFQISCFADNYETNKNIAGQVTAALESWTGATVYQEGESDIFEKETERYHIPLDYKIWYQG